MVIASLNQVTCVPCAENKGKISCWLPLLAAVRPRLRAVGDQSPELGLLIWHKSVLFTPTLMLQSGRLTIIEGFQTMFHVTIKRPLGGPFCRAW